MLKVRVRALVVSSLLAAGLAACGAAPSKGPNESQATNPSAGLSTTTPPPKRDVGAITWAVYRPTTSLDPIAAFDTPENAIIDSLCESLLRQAPDLTVGPGLAQSADYVDPLTLQLKLRHGVRFWDGTPMTSADVVYSLQRARSAQSYYAPAFKRVASISAAGPLGVTISLAKPDYWLRGELSAMPGIVIEKAFAEREGKRYGTPGGGVMCTGPFKLKSWASGGNVVVERDPSYWQPLHRAHASQITFTPVQSDATLSAGFETGSIDGTYNVTLSTYASLKANSNLTVVSGPSLLTDALMVTNLKGPLGDLRVRRALSLALNRPAYVTATYHGEAALPRSSTNPGSWAYGKDVFARTLGKQPVIKQNLQQAKQLVSAAGAKGKSVVMAVSPALTTTNLAAAAVSEALKSIGMKLTLKSLSADAYFGLFSSAGARNGIDLIETINNPDYADPAPYLALYALPGGGSNFSGWQDSQVTALLNSARQTADDNARARLVAQADERVTSQLPWIPLAQVNSVLIMSKKITGAPASFVFENGPWSNMIGSAR